MARCSLAAERDPRAVELERLAADLSADLEAMERIAGDCLQQRDGLAADPADRGRASILALGMHAYYTALESALERIERLLAAPPPPGPNWHQELLWGATRPLGEARPAVIGMETARGLDKLRGFRHFLRHAYAVELDVAELTRTATHLAAVHPRVRRELHDFRELLLKMAGAPDR